MVYNAIRKALYENCRSHIGHLRISYCRSYSLDRQRVNSPHAAAITFIIRYLDRKSKPLS